MGILEEAIKGWGILGALDDLTGIWGYKLFLLGYYVAASFPSTVANAEVQKTTKQGKMKVGQRLAREGEIVSKHAVMDGPFAETKEVIGGYRFIYASGLEEAAKLAAGNPCLACGLVYEIRPIEAVRASAFAVTFETPSDQQ